MKRKVTIINQSSENSKIVNPETKPNHFIFIMWLALLLFLLFPILAIGQKIPYTVDANGVHIQGVDGTNPVIYDNDIIHDTPEVYYLWLKANRKEVNLVGNIATRDMHPQGDPNNLLFNKWMEWYNKAVAAGLKNIPTPIRGAGPQYLVKPSSGNIDDTQYQNNAGSDLIIAEARKASAAKPLVIFVGGNVSTIANAYLKDKTIADKIVVLHFHGYRYQKPTYNTMDFWGAYIVMKKLRYINHSGDLYSGYTGQIPVPTTVDITGMPVNSWTQTFKDNWLGQWYRIHKQIADAPVTLYFFNHGMIKNVVRKLENDQTTTSNTFDYLLVSQNDWPWLKGPAMIDYIRNPANYVPVTTQPPVNQNPVTAITNATTTFVEGSVTLTASASDLDGTIAKVEFFVDGSKVGEDTSSPYTLTRSFTQGLYVIQSRAVDNLGAVGSSSNVTFTITAIPTEPCNCEDGKTPTVEVKETITLPPDQPAQVVKEDTPTGVTFTFKIPKGDKGDNGSGSGTTVKQYWVTDYGAKGDGSDDTKAFQDAFNAAALTKGKVVIPAPASFYKLTNTISVRPPAGQGQVKVSVLAWGGPNNIRYMGPSNKTVFYIVGIKNCVWEGFGIEVANGISGVTVFDIDTEGELISSSTGTKFDTYRINLGDGNNNVGFRMGHNGASGDDISNIIWMNGAIYGTRKPGQVAYLNEGINTLHLQWFETFTAGCDRHYSNNGPTRRGNGGVYFFGAGGSGNNVDYEIAFEQNYGIFGGTWELGKVFLKVPAFAQVSPSILVEGVSIKNYTDSDGLIQVNVPANVSLQNVYMMQSDRGAYTNPVVVNSSAGVGSLVMMNCTLSTNNAMPYQKTGGSWRVTSFGNTKFNTTTGSVVTNKEFFPGEFDVNK